LWIGSHIPIPAQPFVVVLPKIWITEYPIGLMHGMEYDTCLGRGVPIRMTVLDTVTIGTFDLGRVGIAGNAQHLVVVVSKQGAHPFLAL
jgi:hypothetical protein